MGGEFTGVSKPNPLDSLAEFGSLPSGVSRVANTGVVVGILLLILGVAFYFGVQPRGSLAALPVGLGLALALSGVMLRNCSESGRRHVGHFSALIGLTGVICGFIFGLAKDVPTEARQMATNEAWAMAVLCFIYVGVSVKHFISNRRGRAPQGGFNV